MHRDQVRFCKRMRKSYPDKFRRVSVLDVGSMDINGNNRYLFREFSYWGIDVGAGKNVDQVISGHEYANEFKFNFVISTECLEHNRHWKETVLNMFALTKEGGAMLITCASIGRPEHGTHRDHPDCSPATNDYYKNISTFEMNEILPSCFDTYILEYNPKSQDLYFFGIKHNFTSREIYSQLINQNKK